MNARAPILVLASIAFAACAERTPTAASTPPVGAQAPGPRDARHDRETIVKTDDEWKRSLTPEHSFQLSLVDGRLVWTDTKDGQPRQQFHEPSSSWTRRIVAALARVLPVEEQL